MKMVTVHLEGILWDTDGESVDLPTKLVMQVGVEDEDYMDDSVVMDAAIDTASDRSGFCIKGVVAARVVRPGEPHEPQRAKVTPLPWPVANAKTGQLACVPIDPDTAQPAFSLEASEYLPGDPVHTVTMSLDNYNHARACVEAAATPTQGVDVAAVREEIRNLLAHHFPPGDQAYVNAVAGRLLVAIGHGELAQRHASEPASNTPAPAAGQSRMGGMR